MRGGEAGWEQIQPSSDAGGKSFEMYFCFFSRLSKCWVGVK